MKRLFSGRLLPWLSMGLGGVTLALRSWLYTGGIDEKGLFVASHPAGILAFIVAALFLGLLALCVASMNAKTSYAELFPQSTVAAVGSAVGGLGILLTAVNMVLRPENAIALVCGFVGIPAAACRGLCGWCCWRQQRPSFLFHGITTLFLLLYCICQYRLWSTEPQLGASFFQLRACVLLMLYGYQRTAMDAGIGNAVFLTFVGQAAIFFCLATIPDANPLFFLCMALWCATGTPSFSRKTGGDGIAAS